MQGGSCQAGPMSRAGRRDPLHASCTPWLVKSEPTSFAWADLLAARKQTTRWDGVRNYQARNFLRDAISVGDLVFFYRSCARPLGIVGEMRVTRAGYPDPTQFDPNHPGFDPASRRASPRWYGVDVQAVRTYDHVVELASLRTHPACQDMLLLRRASRLSVQPVPLPAARTIRNLAGVR